MAKIDLKEFVVTETRLPADRVVCVQEIGVGLLGAIGFGILLVVARWSPFPQICLKRMASVLPEFFERYSLRFYVVDHDALTPELMEKEFGRVLHGGAETFWVKEGCVISESVGCAADYESRLRLFTERLCSG